MEQYRTKGPYQIDIKSIKTEPDIKPVSNLLFIDSIKSIKNLKKQIFEENFLKKSDMKLTKNIDKSIPLISDYQLNENSLKSKPKAKLVYFDSRYIKQK